MASSTTELILIRHGETEWNAEGRYMNQLDSPLSPIGLRQAECLAERFARFPFDALYCSDLGRAVATCAVIARACGKSFEELPELRELCTGVFAGHTEQEVERMYPAELENVRTDVDYAPPGGESRRVFHQRTLDCLSRLVLEHAGGRVVAVTHGGSLGVAFRHTAGLPIGVRNPARTLNASVNVLEVCENAWNLRTWGDVSHLIGQGLTE